MINVNLSGKVALITGGSRGLGRAMALGLARAGADVVVASRKLDSCEKVCAEVRALGVRALAVAAHTGDMASLDNLINTSLAQMGKVDILINNAGINPGMGGLSDLTPDLFDSTAQAIPGFEQDAANACLQKRIADTDEILGPVLYLVSDLGSYTTGTTVVADGGYMVL